METLSGDFLVSCTPMLDDKGRIQKIIHIATEITERKHAETALKASEKKLRNIVEHSNEIFYIHDTKHRFTYVSPQSLSILGYSPDEMLMEWTKLITENPMNEAGVEITERALRTGKKQRPYLIEVFRKGGSRVLLEIDESPLKDDKGKVIGMIGAARDVTEMKHAQEEKTKLQIQLLHSQKLEAVGQLAGGIAHDFNNILTAIITYGHFLKMKINDDHLRNYADHILALSEKAATLTSGLLAFSRKQIINLRPVDLNEIIRNVEEILFRIIGEDIVLQSALYGEDLSPFFEGKRSGEGIYVMADPGQIEQVIMNFATNARDAMPQGGVLSIETRIVELDNAFIKSRGYGKTGRYALLSVRDTGTGIDENTRERIFEPFFTTKEMGKGTGLGLAMVYGIIKQHEGFIDVSSKPGKGTTFEIYLPLIHSETGSANPKAVVPVRGGNETILLAEDDHDVRASTREILEKFGYTVIEAKNGEEAVYRFTENGAVIQLALLDMIMPKKGGKEACEEIRKMDPHMKILFSSGYTDDDNFIKGTPGRGYDVIQKPVHPNTLLKKIRDILDSGKKD